MKKIYFVIKKIGDINPNGDSLPLHILEHCLGKKNKEATFTSIFSYCVLNELLNYFNVDINDLFYSSNGKPLLKEGYVSLSHSNDYVCVSYSTIKHGIDIQFYSDIKNQDSIFKRYFNYKYSDYLMKDEENKKDFFYQLWTLKEAIVKKDDISLFENLIKENIYTFNNVFIKEEDRYSFSVASDEPFEIKEMHF